jgi:hypothetical protein
MPDNDIAHALAALSSRVNALEGAIHALTVGGHIDPERVLAAFDSYSQQMFVPARIVWTRFCSSGCLAQGIGLTGFQG